MTAKQNSRPAFTLALQNSNPADNAELKDAYSTIVEALSEIEAG